MENLPLILVALACPIGMGLMMLFMGRGLMSMGRGAKQDAVPDIPGVTPDDPEKRLALLQAQRELLDAQIAATAKSEAARATADEATR